MRKYFEVPEDVLNDYEQLRLWANEAMRVAGKTKPNKEALKRSLLTSAH